MSTSSGSPARFAARLPFLMPLAVEWATAQAAHILAAGAPLTTEGLGLAQRVGVRAPAAVRVLHVPRIPGPEHPALRAACEALGFLGASTAGLTLGSGIFIREDLASQRALLAHELRHVAQYEEYPSIAGYLARYVPELLEFGYEHAPFEVDARRMEVKSSD
jgi:hypothetical protein